MSEANSNPVDFFQQFAAQFRSFGMPSAAASNGTPADQATSQEGAKFNPMWVTAIQQWTRLTKSGLKHVGRDDWRKLFEPAQWMRANAGSFDAGLERLLDGPKYSTLWAVDEKVLRLTQLAAQRSKDSADYHRLVQTAWNNAADSFASHASGDKGKSLANFRDIAELWIETANQALLQMHRSEAFLDAQRRLTRSATDYRLQERELAEMFCEIHHLPSRTEVDEMQRTLSVLRREVRSLKRGNGQVPMARPNGLAPPRVPKKSTVAAKPNSKLKRKVAEVRS